MKTVCKKVLFAAQNESFSASLAKHAEHAAAQDSLTCLALADWFFVVFSEKPVEQVHDSFLKADAIAPFCKGSNDPLLGIRFHENADR